MINHKLSIVCILLLLTCSLPAKADSVWTQESSSPYSHQKAHKVGDIINILILETTTAQKKAGTKTNVRDDLGFQFTHNLSRLSPVLATSNKADGLASNKYSGVGQTERSSKIRARVGAWVTDILPNGNLAIKANHKTEVNGDTQEILITGIIRPEDVSGSNTVYSYQVAKADLVIKGTGAVADTESPGWITRLFNWLF